MPQTLLNIGRNSLKRRNFIVMANKVVLRLAEYPQRKQKEKCLIWSEQQAESAEAFARALSPELWEETQESCRKIKAGAQAKLDALDIDLGGGGHYPFLYFLTRYLSPKTIVETGVAAGWSSQALLTALKKNGAGGKLYSSDFPYFRCEDPEKLIGYVVDNDLKDNWHLFIDGDLNNLPQIAGKINSIDLFHYDSDKSYTGRKKALEILAPKFHAGSVLIFDDIQDNFHFKDYVAGTGKKFRVFEFEGKYVGFIAPFL